MNKETAPIGYELICKILDGDGEAAREMERLGYAKEHIWEMVIDECAHRGNWDDQLRTIKED